MSATKTEAEKGKEQHEQRATQTNMHKRRHTEVVLAPALVTDTQKGTQAGSQEGAAQRGGLD